MQKNDTKPQSKDEGNIVQQEVILENELLEGIQDVPIAPPVDHTSNIQQAETYLKERYVFRKNVVFEKVEISTKGEGNFKQMTDRDYNSIYRKLQKAGIKISITTLRGLLNSDFVNMYNPFQEYFTSLPVWDGETDYILELAKTVKTTDDEFWYDCLKRWLVAFVGCAIEENIINHTVIVFAGKQGIGKTTWHLNLVPDILKDYRYSGNIKPNNKDSIIHLSECILINLDELEVLNRSELGDLKEMITKSAIRVRRPYGYTNEKYVRRASFAGSVNKTEFLTDTTGSRRFLCFEAVAIDYTTPIKYELVYAQALHLFKNGFKYWFDNAEVENINSKNEKFRTATVEEELLLKYYEPAPSLTEGVMAYTSTEIAQVLTSSVKTGLSNSFVQRLGKALHKQNFTRVKFKGLYKYYVRRVAS